MSNALKGVIVAFAAIAVVCIQIAFVSHSQLESVLSATVVLGICGGMYAGRLAARVRSDRKLVLVGLGLALPSFYAFAWLLVTHQRGVDTPWVKQIIGLSGLPIVVAMLVLERWTRPIEPLPVAAPNVRRSWTNVELGVVLAVAASLASLVVIRNLAFARVAFLVSVAIPIGVVLGRLASVMTRLRLVTLLAIAGAGTMWASNCVEIFWRANFDPRVLIAPALAAVVLDRFSHRHRDRVPLDPVMLGMLIAAANGIVIGFVAIAFLAQNEPRLLWEMTIVPTAALMFAVPGGAMFGAMAASLKSGRRVILQTLGAVAVCFLGAGFEVPIIREPSALYFFLISCATTAIGLHVLERATRARS